MKDYSFKGSKRIHQKEYRSGVYQKTPAITLEAADKLHFVAFNAERLGIIKEYNRRFSINVTYDKLDNVTYTINQQFNNIDKFFNGIEKGFVYDNISTRNEGKTATNVYETQTEIINEVRELINSVNQNRINYLNSKDAYIRSFCLSNIETYTQQYKRLRVRINKALEYNKEIGLLRVKDFLNDFIENPIFQETGSGRVQKRGFIHCCILTYDGDDTPPKGFGFVEPVKTTAQIDERESNIVKDQNASINYQKRKDGNPVGKKKGINTNTRRIPKARSQKRMNK